MASSAPALHDAQAGDDLSGKLWHSKLLVAWHLCSLDAPSVAGLWTWFAVRVSGSTMPGSLPFAIAVAVWILYAADRLLDARDLGVGGSRDNAALEARHYFHRRHRAGFLWGIALCLPVLAGLVSTLPSRLIGGFAVEGVLLVVWFAWIHREKPAGTASRLPKELMVGLFFASAVFLPTISHVANLFPAILFAGLLTLNGLFIRVWEHGQQNGFRHVSTLAWMFGIVAAASASTVYRQHPSWSLVAVACALSLGLLLLLHRLRHTIERTTLRAAADAALLTPLLLLSLLYS